MPLEIAVRVPPCAPVPELVALARRMEAGGIDRVSFPDSQLLWRDVWATLAATAVGTTRIGLAVSVTNPVTRHPSVTAGAARTIGELAPGRFELHIGIGDSAVTHVGLRGARRADLESAVSAIGTLLAGGEVADDKQPWRLHDPVRVPVLVGTSGPRNLAMAGRIADGALVPSIAWERDWGIVRDAAVAAGRDPGQLAFVSNRPCIVTDEPERDAALFKPMCLWMAQMGGAEVFAEAGVPVEVPEHDLRFGDLGHLEDWGKAVEICSEWITDEAAMWFARTRAVFGRPDEVVEQLAALERAGLKRIQLAHPGAFSLPVELVDALVERVLPLASEAGLRRVPSHDS